MKVVVQFQEQESQVADVFSPIWESVWAVNLASPPKFISFSPDGSLLATCGVHDRMIKIWFRESGDFCILYINIILVYICIFVLRYLDYVVIV